MKAFARSPWTGHTMFCFWYASDSTVVVRLYAVSDSCLIPRSDHFKALCQRLISKYPQAEEMLSDEKGLTELLSW